MEDVLTDEKPKPVQTEDVINKLDNQVEDIVAHLGKATKKEEKKANRYEKAATKLDLEFDTEAMMQ